MTYIERELLLDKSKKLAGSPFGAPLIIAEIEKAKREDVVKVVRCKDCKHYHNSGYCIQIGMSKDRFMNDFCSRGESRGSTE